MTPRQIHELRKRHILQLQREECLVGMVAATTANHSFNPPKKALTPEDFMMHKLPTPPEDPTLTQGDRLLNKLLSLPEGAAIKAE